MSILHVITTSCYIHVCLNRMSQKTDNLVSDFIHCGPLPLVIPKRLSQLFRILDSSEGDSNCQIPVLQKCHQPEANDLFGDRKKQARTILKHSPSPQGG